MTFNQNIKISKYPKRTINKIYSKNIFSSARLERTAMFLVIIFNVNFGN